MCQASARRRATHALPEHVLVCIVPAPPPPPPAPLRSLGRGFRTEGMPPAKQPDAYPPPLVRRPRRVFVTTAPSSHAPRPCPPGTSAMLSCCGGTRYPLSPPPPKRCRVHTEGVGGGGNSGRGNFCGESYGFLIGAEIFPTNLFARPGPDLCLWWGVSAGLWCPHGVMSYCRPMDRFVTRVGKSTQNAPLSMESRPQALLIWHLLFPKNLGVPKFPATVPKAPKFGDAEIVPGRNPPPSPRKFVLWHHKY